MSTELNPCGCGAKPIEDGKDVYLRIRCEKCGAQGPAFSFDYDVEDESDVDRARGEAIANWNASHPAATSGLHDAILRLPCNAPSEVLEKHSYKVGHRDARHAAAELASAHESQSAPAQQESAPAPAMLTDEQIDYIARQYFAEHVGQEDCKNAIHDAFLAAAGSSQQAAPAVNDDEWDKLIYPPRAFLKPEDWDANTKQPKPKPVAAPAQSEAPDERTSFEAWAKRTHGRPGTHFDQSHNGVYKDNRIAAKWAAWQARARLAPAAAQQDALAAAMAIGYEGGIMVSAPGDVGGSVTLHYVSPDVAERAFEAFSNAVDAAIAAMKGAPPHPSTLGGQVAQAQADVVVWSPVLRVNLRLKGQ